MSSSTLRSLLLRSGLHPLNSIVEAAILLKSNSRNVQFISQPRFDRPEARGSISLRQRRFFLRIFLRPRFVLLAQLVNDPGEIGYDLLDVLHLLGLAVHAALHHVRVGTRNKTLQTARVECRI